jgi:hypothetical protein
MDDFTSADTTPDPSDDNPLMALMRAMGMTVPDAATMRQHHKDHLTGELGLPDDEAERLMIITEQTSTAPADGSILTDQETLRVCVTRATRSALGDVFGNLRALLGAWDLAVAATADSLDVTVPDDVSSLVSE